MSAMDRDGDWGDPQHDAVALERPDRADGSSPAPAAQRVSSRAPSDQEFAAAWVETAGVRFPAPRLLAVHEGLAVGAWRDVVILAWRCELRMDLVDLAGKAFAELAPVRPVGLFATVDPGWPLPGREERAAYARVLRSLPLAFGAVVYEGGGFYLAAVQAVVTAWSLLRSNPAPTRVFDATASAARWAVAKCPAAGPLDQLEEAVRFVQAARPDPAASTPSTRVASVAPVPRGSSTGVGSPGDPAARPAGVTPPRRDRPRRSNRSPS